MFPFSLFLPHVQKMKDLVAIELLPATRAEISSQKKKVETLQKA